MVQKNCVFCGEGVMIEGIGGEGVFGYLVGKKAICENCLEDLKKVIRP